MRVVRVVALLLLAVASARAGGAAPVADAQRWMALVDGGNYAESWSAAGTTFKARITRQAWTNAVAAARKPLGSVLSRSTLAETRAKSLPGVPDGDYAVIQFSTVFAHKKSAIETVVLAHEPVGWLVDGYFVK